MPSSWLFPPPNPCLPPARPPVRAARLPQLVHGDVFRFPPHLNLFCAVVGTGTQILVLALLIFSLSLLGTYYPYNGGAMLTSVVVLYALTAGIAGYVSAALYKIMGGEHGCRCSGGGWGGGGDAGHGRRTVQRLVWLCCCCVLVPTQQPLAPCFPPTVAPAPAPLPPLLQAPTGFATC